jgi:hypothetical protein
MIEYPTCPNPPETVEDCDKWLKYWSSLSSLWGLPVIDGDGKCAIDNLLELRSKISEYGDDK